LCQSARLDFRGQILSLPPIPPRAMPRGLLFVRTSIMAKANSVKIKLVSSADTGFYYVTKKNARTMTEKLTMKKYDPVARKHVDFKESKIK
jgi:large subunit ribosomal protein L33